MLAVLCLFAVCLSAAVANDYNDVMRSDIVRGYYEDVETDRLRHNFSVKRESTTLVDNVHWAETFQQGEETYLSFSYYDDGIRLRGNMPIYRFDDESLSFEPHSFFPNERAENLETGVYIDWFTTNDGRVWAYSALTEIEDITVRNRTIVSYTGESYIYEFVDGQVVTPPAFQWVTYRSTESSEHFTTQDGRQFLFTWSYGRDEFNPLQGTEFCQIIEYTPDTAPTNWNIADAKTPFCNSFPRIPIVFDSIGIEHEAHRVYYLPKYATSVKTGNTWVKSTQGVGQTFFSYSDNGNKQFTAESWMDNFAITNLKTAWHFTDETFDMILAVTEDGIHTYRLWWATHWVEELAPIATPQSPNWFDWIMIGDRRCFILGFADHEGRSNRYAGRSDAMPTVYDDWIPVYCWDATHDDWDLTLRIPAEGAWFTESFKHGDETYIVSVQDYHHWSSSIHVHSVYVDEDEWYPVYTQHLPDTAEVWKELKDMQHDNTTVLALVSSILGLVVLSFFALLLMIVMSGGKSGGGSGTDYSSF